MTIRDKSLLLFSAILTAWMSASLMSANIEHDAVDDIDDAVDLLIDVAVNDKRLFVLEDGHKCRSSNFFGFYYQIPRSIKQKDEARFIKHLRKAIQERRIVGKNRRPVALILKSPLKKKNAIEKKVYSSRNTFEARRDNFAY